MIYNHLYDFAENTLNSVISGFLKAYSTQHALLKLLQSWQKEIDNHVFLSTILMNFSKVYDCISHELLIAKLHSFTNIERILSVIAFSKTR